MGAAQFTGRVAQARDFEAVLNSAHLLLLFCLSVSLLLFASLLLLLLASHRKNHVRLLVNRRCFERCEARLKQCGGGVCVYVCACGFEFSSGFGSRGEVRVCS